MRRHLVALLSTAFGTALFIITILAMSALFTNLREERAYSALQKASLVATLAGASNMPAEALISEMQKHLALLGQEVAITDQNGQIIAGSDEALTGQNIAGFSLPLFRDASLPPIDVRAAYYSAPILRNNKFNGYVLVKQNFSATAAGVSKRSHLLIGTALILFILLVIASDLMVRRIIFRPVNRLEKIVASCGFSDLLSADKESHELSTLGHTIAQMNIKLQEDRDFQKEQLEKLKEAHHELEITKTALTSAERVAFAGRLASSIAHDVGNPLGVVQGYLTMLEALNSSEQHLVIQKMQRELDRITSAIHSLLDVSRPITLERAPLEIAPWLAALCENLTKMARLTGVSLSLENSLPAGFTFSLDKERLTAVLENLIINAADAMNSNSADKERKIRITAALNDKNLKINIIDNGPGISQENREKVFEPFFSTKPANRGSGLGLYTAKQIIELHGGKISLTNEIDGGLNVAVLLAA